MFRLLPWSSVVGGNKVTAEEVKLLAAQRNSPVMETPSLHKLKRKRTNSSTESDAAMRDNVAPTPTQKGESRPTSQESNMEAVVVSLPKAKEAKVNGAEKAATPANTVTQKKSSSSASPQLQNSGQVSPPSQEQEESTPALSPSHQMDPDTLRQTVESQLSIEILLKHDELRLIDQEIAKCQVALDQLRRCAEIPYPGSTVSGISDSVSSGVGPAVLPPGNGRAPVSPSPWGVNEGPYSRHYAKWLLPDPRFDGGDVEHLQPSVAGKAPLDARTTRGSWPEPSAFTGSLRSQRSSAGAKLQSLSNGYPQPKDKAGPMIIKRKSDGQLVKLVCLDCRRDNFSSTQGFINHCRIAHNRNFASHDAAAAASGEPVEVDEAGMVVGNNNDTSGGAPAGYVHPLIRSAHAIGSTQKSTPRRGSPQSSSKKSSNGNSTQDSQRDTPQSITPLQTQNSFEKQQASQLDGTVHTPISSFKASPDAPHLSALLERRGMSLDLLDIVDDAKTKAELDMYSSDEESGDEVEDTSTKLNSEQTRSTRLPARTVVSPSHPPRPSSQKGKDKSNRKPHSPVAFQPPTSGRPNYSSTFPPAMTASNNAHTNKQNSQGDDVDMLDPMAVDYSPNTVESNQAPSLISDDGDYEARSDSGSPSPSSSESSVDERAFDNIEVRDGDEGSAGTASTTEAKPAPDMPSPAHHPSPVPSRTHKKKGTTKSKRGAAKDTAAGASNADAVKDQKRVSFVSPVSSPSKAKKDGTKKQRRA